jgi:cytochrome bd-type quinol oxidase subunit 1
MALLDAIDEQELETQAVEDKVDDQIKRLQAKAQSRIAWVIIWAFVVAVAAIFVLVLGDLFMTFDCKPPENCVHWKDPSKFLLEIVSSVLLPIVTLVLGYYFGKEKVE